MLLKFAICAISMSSHFAKLENMYHNHNLNSFFNASIRISEGQAEIEIPLDEKFHHAAHAVHGAVYFKILDDVGFFAANSVVEDALILTANFTIYFLKPVALGRMKGVGKLVYKSNSQFIADTVLYNSEGEEIARGTGTYIKTKIEIPYD